MMTNVLEGVDNCCRNFKEIPKKSAARLVTSQKATSTEWMKKAAGQLKNPGRWET